MSPETYNDVRSALEIFWSHLKTHGTSSKIQLWVILLQNCSQMTFETQKSPEGRVWSLRMRLRGRTTFPFAFVDTYDPNGVCEDL